MKVNLGCGLAYVRGWTNVDASDDVRADIHLDAKTFIEVHGQDTTQLYMGHFLEHLMPTDALELLQSMIARLPAGAEVSAVAPDIRQIFQAYEINEMTNRELNEWYIYSYIQPSHHLWCHDEASLTALFQAAGFHDVVPIEPSTWPPVWHKDGLGARYQSGVRGTVPASESGAAGTRPDLDGTQPLHSRGGPTAPEAEPVVTAPENTDEHMARLVRMVAVEAYRRNAVDAELAAVRSQLESIVRSRSFRLANASRGVVRALAPTGTVRARVARSAVSGALKLTRRTSQRD